MPSRQKISLIEIADRKNLAHAVYLAAKGKRFRFSVQQYLGHLDHHLGELSDAILSESYVPEPFRELIVHDPKRRIIHAPTFRDRVLHHALVLQIGPQIERTLVDDSFACRLGKGTIAAVLRAQHFSRRAPWFVKVDISKYFHNVDHELLIQRLTRRFKGPAFLRLIDRLIGSFQSTPGKGLPIGALTSQYFANLYLNDADRWLVARRDVLGMVRYMDDLICWAPDKISARRIFQELQEFLDEQLKLVLKPGSQINRAEQGVTFCGLRIFPGIIRLTTRRKKRYRAACRRWERQFLQGKLSANGLQDRFASAFSMVKHANAVEWRRRRLGEHAVDEI